MADHVPDRRRTLQSQTRLVQGGAQPRGEAGADADADHHAGDQLRHFHGHPPGAGHRMVVLVPAEMLGVTSGLGYAIKDARETLSYHHLTAMVLTIGIIGYLYDTCCVFLLRRFSWHRGDI